MGISLVVERFCGGSIPSFPTKTKQNKTYMEEILINKRDFDNFYLMNRENDQFIFNGETYSFITKEIIGYYDNCFRVILQRESDKKFFEYTWGISGNCYYFNPNFKEVLEEKEIKEIVSYK